MRRSNIWRELREELLVLPVKGSALHWLRRLIRMFPRGFPATTNWKEDPGEMICVEWPVEGLRILQGELESVAGKKDIWETLLSLLPS